MSQLTEIQIKKKSKDWDFILAIVAICIIILAAFIGYSQNSSNINSRSIEPALKRAEPLATRFVVLSEVTCAAYQDESDDSFLSYISIGEANGYGGPMLLAVATNLEGEITGISVIEQKETPSWFKKVSDFKFLETLIGKSYNDNFTIDDDVHAVTGATVTSRAMAQAALEASRSIASNQLDFSVPPKEAPKVQFGIPEIVLLLLYAVGFIGHRKSFKYTKQARWFSMLTGMIVLGFMYTNPLTISVINQFLLGFWPDWHTNLYYFMLLGGVLLVLLIDNKNPYCLWICPFGAVQECMGLVGGAKQAKTNPKLTSTIKWAQRALAFTAIVVALLFQNPGLSSYEIFGTLFNLNGTIFQFWILAMVLVFAIFFRRPWCNFLCPIPPIEGFIKLFRKKVKDVVWKKK